MAKMKPAEIDTKFTPKFVPLVKPGRFKIVYGGLAGGKAYIIDKNTVIEGTYGEDED